ncbi:MAG: ABC transporter permease subunit, partial [Gemmatimonadetes bacterium]|nr:ABC transporter permease subunit [Gemmatimonadota bacterium]
EQTSKVIVVALVSFFPIVVNLVDGLRATDREMVDMMRTLGARRRQVFAKLQVPMALPFLFSGLKVGAVVAVIGAVIGEWVGAQSGLGWLMKVSGPQFKTPLVFAAIVWLSAMAIVLFLLVVAAERWALRKYPK